MKTKVFILILAIIMGLSFAACTSAPAPAAQEPAAEAPAPAAQEPAADAPAPADDEQEIDSDYVLRKGAMIVGYTVFAPMNYTDDDGNFTGFDTELTIKVCEMLGVAPDFVEIDWSTKEIELSAKNIDAIWNGMTITPERQAEMYMTKPYLQNAQVIVMKADAEYVNTESLAGMAIVAEMGSAGEKTIEEDPGLSQGTYIAKDKQTSCLMEVAAGTADAAVLDLTLAMAMIGEGSDYANLAIKDSLNPEYYGIAFRQGSDLRDKVDAILDELYQNGSMQELAEKYELVLASR